MTAKPLIKPRPQSVLFEAGDAALEGHDALTKASLAAALARFLGVELSAARSAGCAAAPSYVVPCQTLTAAHAQRLGIRSADDLFGGVAPQPFIATKSITHPLVAPDAQAPTGWRPVFAALVAPVVLEGYSTFSPGDARRACTRLLKGGSVRLKDAGGAGGGGQAVATNPWEFEALMASGDFADPWRDGLVLERNLHQVETVSVGQVEVDGWLLSYHGQQRLTRDRCGKQVYGGSTLHLVRGGFDTLLRSVVPAPRRLAIEQAQRYHRAAFASYAGLFSSRSNYDVAQGVDEHGTWHSGVLEQSWRIGGASGAEIAALELFRDNPQLGWVQASTHEIHADEAALPAGAQLHYDGGDAHGGRLIKFTTVDAYGDA